MLGAFRGFAYLAWRPISIKHGFGFLHALNGRGHIKEPCGFPADNSTGGGNCQRDASHRGIIRHVGYDHQILTTKRHPSANHGAAVCLDRRLGRTRTILGVVNQSFYRPWRIKRLDTCNVGLFTPLI